MEKQENNTKNILIIIGLGIILMSSLAIFWFITGSKRGAVVSKAMHNQEASQTEYQANPQGGEFVLHSADGEVKLSDFRGKLVLMFFGYTTCTTACPASMNEIANTMSRLTPEELEQVQPIFISFDQERDTLADIKEYSGYFHPKIIGLGGSNEEISAVAKQFGAIYTRDNMIESELGYGFSHTSTTYLIDQNGVYADSFPFDLGYEIIADELKYRLANPPVAATPQAQPTAEPKTTATVETPAEQSFDAFAPANKE